MTMRDKIAEIVFGKLGAAFHGNTGNLLALELADAIIAALPDYAAQQARIAELELALKSVLKAVDDNIIMVRPSERHEFIELLVQWNDSLDLKGTET
jgi:hypothetical protein